MTGHHSDAVDLTGDAADVAAADAPVAPRPTAGDMRVIARQLGRVPRPMSAVAVRCPHGFPAVVEMLPRDDHGRPFPTLYYLTCPTAVSAVGALETAGGVRRFQCAVDADDGLRASLAEAVRDTRARRAELAGHVSREAAAAAAGVAGAAALATGVGGVVDPSRLKCLHAHTAHALARPGYALGEAVLAEVGELWCDDRRCGAGVTEALSAGAETPGTVTVAP